MASNTDAISSASMFIEISTNCNDVTPTWTDVCADISELTSTGGDRQTSETNTFCSEDSSITLVGNKNPVEVTLTALYTETAGNAWQVLWPEFATIAGSCDVGIRWTPAGNISLVTRFTLCGVLTNVELPTGAANSSDPVTVGITVRGSVTTDTTP